MKGVIDIKINRYQSNEVSAWRLNIHPQRGEINENAILKLLNALLNNILSAQALIYGRHID